MHLRTVGLVFLNYGDFFPEFLEVKKKSFVGSDWKVCAGPRQDIDNILSHGYSEGWSI